MIYLFNSDFEENLFRGVKKVVSTKKNQEFEYFIHWVEPKSTIFTTKNYTNEYVSFVKYLTGEEIKTTSKNENVHFWCNNYDNSESLKKYQDKNRTLKFLRDHGLINTEIDFINSENALEEGYLYKCSKMMSGMGHFLFPKDQIKLKKLLNSGEVLAKEKPLKRVCDFSALVEKGEIKKIYQNEVDEFFQYKGTLIAPQNFDIGSNFVEQYEDCLKAIINYVNPYSGVYSIDSFIYEEGESKSLYPACEINMRKTMGYIAFKLWLKFSKPNEFSKLKLLRNKGNLFSHKNLYDAYEGRVILLSPVDNFFNTFFITGESEETIKKIENDLILRFF